ncbi:ATP-binding protein [Buchnera aphidicola]|uniref:AAA family ATPase n=1 Tax=Buchnera aphidicola (Stegophylla sp.) TaxID=2315800 RepID=A0A4D6YDW8_9GAMM|nr:ATP-binding protein [Buchnera aphidicola (Stegophylla sp.)]QCI26223.1 AAA family ATPase [Buchnera aphidicola (Stegophylla sp.)]
MKNIKFLNKLKKIIPNNIQPKFKNDYDVLKWNQKKGKLFCQSIIKKNNKIKKQNMLKKSGIQALYINCSFDNYIIEHEGHKKVITLAKKYVQEFNNNINNFVFSGWPGTGKNHLASAIANYLINQKKSVFIITIADLMSNIKKTFNRKLNVNDNEENLLYYLSTRDLLIIDEIGIQIESRYERMIIHQIVDRRYSSKKPTGMLSNLNYYDMIRVLGERVMDRMCLGNNLWLDFKWNSYRKNIS